MSSSSDGKLATDLDMNPQYRRRERRRNRARKMSSRSLKDFARILKTCLLGSEIVRKADQQLVSYGHGARDRSKDFWVSEGNL
jgi:hypothetical protein